MCFAPQRRALFRHLNLQKWRDLSVGPHLEVEMSKKCTPLSFPSQNVQNTRFSDHFWKLRCRKSARRCGAKHIWKSKCAKHVSVGRLLEVEKTPNIVLYILTCKCASRHNGVQFFISHLAGWLRTHRFSEPTFRPSGAPNHLEKQCVSRLSYLFSHLHLLSSYTLSLLLFFLLIFLFSLPLPCSAFHLSILSEV